MFCKSLEKISIPPMKGRVAVKLHMGEPQSLKTRVSPADVRTVVDMIKANGGEPFLFDTTTLYRRERYTREKYLAFAKKNGFAEFDIVIADDADFSMVDGYPVPNQLMKADAMFVLSHAKGHMFAAFGGAIKNLGMGCVNKEGKRNIHMFTKPKYDRSKCVACGACVRACDDGFVHLEDGGIRIELEDCSGCGACVESCPKGALWREQGSMEESFRRLAEAAKAVVSWFGRNEKPVFYVNVLKNITERCDCSLKPGKIVCPDIGYLTGSEPLQIDIETVKMIRETSPNALDWDKWDIFVKAAKKCF